MAEQPDQIGRGEHTSVSPHTNLDIALANFDIIILTQQSPIDWLNASKSHVLACVRGFTPGFTEKQRDECIGLIRDFPSYTRYIVHIYAHLILCRRDRVALSRLVEKVTEWMRWDDALWLSEYDQAKGFLVDLIHQEASSETTTGGCSETSHTDRLLMLDEVAICAQLRVIQKDPFRYKAILALRAERAQHLLNCLQTRSDDPALHPDLKRFSVVLLIELAHGSGLYPECLARKDIQIIGKHPVGGGSFGDVYRGLMKGQLVAVKVLRIFEDSDIAQLLKGFSYEAVTWRQLSHPNVLPFYGIHHLHNNPSRLCLVSPWMGNGRVTQFLKRFPTTDRVYLILDIAEGLEYLHNLKPFIIHGDLKGANILVTASGRACLADFGLAIVIDSQVIRSSPMESAGTPRWQAPELLQGDFGDVEHCYGNSSRESDIYAFACVCYELISGNVPFHEIRAPYQVMVAVTKGQRPSRPPHDHGMIHGLDNLWTLIETCWATYPANRLTASQIVETIQSWPDHSADRRAPQQWDDVSAAIMAVFEEVASNLSQDNLLALVESDPVRWQSVNTRLIISAIHNLTKLSRSDALECSKIVQDVGVYQRLLAYTFAHMRLCDADDQVLGHIKQVSQVWRTWDAMTSLSHYWLVKKDLFACLRESQQAHVYPKLEEVLAIDIVAMYAQLGAIIGDRTRYKDLLTIKNASARAVLDILQTLQNSSSLGLISRTKCATALVQLASASAQFPPCLVIRGVTREEKFAVAYGSHSDIFKGTFQGRGVAVRTLRRLSSSWPSIAKILKAFAVEAVIWGRFCHPSILPFYGVHLDECISSFVSPWMEHGNIVQFLKRELHPDRDILILDIAQGLEYLHTGLDPNIIHGDLKGTKVLITPSKRACLSGFALSRHKYDLKSLPAESTASTSEELGALRWTAPELLHLGVPSFAGDVYAFACTVYQIFSGKHPFHEFTRNYPVVTSVMEGKRPARPTEAPLNDNIWSLVEACWAQQPNVRPSATQIVQRLVTFTRTRGYVDRRPEDEWDNPLEANSWPLAGHPFSAYSPDYGVNFQEQEETD